MPNFVPLWIVNRSAVSYGSARAKQKRNRINASSRATGFFIRDHPFCSDLFSAGDRSCDPGGAHAPSSGRRYLYIAPRARECHVHIVHVPLLCPKRTIRPREGARSVFQSSFISLESVRQLSNVSSWPFASVPVSTMRTAFMACSGWPPINFRGASFVSMLLPHQLSISSAR